MNSPHSIYSIQCRMPLTPPTPRTRRIARAQQYAERARERAMTGDPLWGHWLNILNRFDRWSHVGRGEYRVEPGELGILPHYEEWVPRGPTLRERVVQ